MSLRETVPIVTSQRASFQTFPKKNIGHAKDFRDFLVLGAFLDGSKHSSPVDIGKVAFP